MDQEPELRARARSLTEALAAMRDGDVSQTRLSRLSDLSRDGARTLAETWHSLPEAVRVEIVRRCDELSEERVDLGFHRALRVALDDASPVVRQLAIQGLWEDESQDLLERLRRILRVDPSPDVRGEAAAALSRFAQQAAAGFLDATVAQELRQEIMTVARDEAAPYVVRRRALEALGPFGADPDASALVEDAFRSGDHGMHCSALYAMGLSRNARWLPHILGEIESDEPEVRFESARAAGLLGSADALPLLLEAACDEDAEVRHAAIGSIGQIGGRGASRALERLAEDAGEADLELIEAAADEVEALLEPFQST